jgi:hypothetical protein
MASEVRNFAVAVPSETPIATPQVTDLSMPARIVRSVRVRVPPGPAGLVGWALGAAGVRVLPWGADEWIVADDEVLEWPLTGQIESGAWQLHAYNLGIHTHTLYVTFLVDPPSSAADSIGQVPLVVVAD